MTTPAGEPGERRPLLDRPPGDRYVAGESESVREPGRLNAVLLPLALVLGTAVGFVILGGILGVTAALVIPSAFLGWLTGRLVSPPSRAAVVGLAAIATGLLGIWLFGRYEGGVMDPIAYLAEVEGPITVVLSLLAGGGLAAAASR